MRIALVLAVSACGAPPPVAPHTRPPRVAGEPAPGAAGEPARRFRQLTTGTLSGHARRTTFVLTFRGDLATLTETEEQAAGASSIAEADLAPWVVRSTRRYRGSRHRDGAGFDLALATSDMQPLNLHCVTATVTVAGPGVRRVPSSSRGVDDACGDRGVWDPSTTSPVEAVVCGAAGQSLDDAEDDDRLVFALDPGIEWAFENDGCALRGGGLRRIAR